MRRIPSRPAHPHRRGGFTLVELLVAAALSLVVMTVLALAFQTGLQSLSSLKSVVGLAEQLRAAEGIIRADLSAAHLEDPATGEPVRVSALSTGAKGYFHFTQGESLALPASVGGTPIPEGAAPVSERALLSLTDPDNPRSFRTPSAARTLLTDNQSGRAWADYLTFTVRLKGDGPQEVFTTDVGPTNLAAGGPLVAATDPGAQGFATTSTQYVSRWAEVAYFLLPANAGVNKARVFTNDENGLTAQPVYTLYRRQRLLAPVTTPLGAALNPIPAGVAVVKASSGNPTVIGPDAISFAGNRLGVVPIPLVSGTAADPVAVDATTTGQLASLDPLPTAAPPALSIQREQLARPYPIPVSYADRGSDVLVSNVVSMTVRPVYDLFLDASTTQAVAAFAAANPSISVVPRQGSFQPQDMPEPLTGAIPPTPAFPRFYDTAGGGLTPVFRNELNGAPLNAAIFTGTYATVTPAIERFTLRAIELKLRVYDPKNKTTRQMTVLQDL